MKRIYNISTNPIFLPLYAEGEVLHEQFVPTEGGQYVKEFRTRTEIKVGASKALEGTHHEKMHAPAFIDVNEKEFAAIQRCPLFQNLCQSGVIRYNETPKE